ncbi:hypothetical protein DBV15_10710 [Temnothorax longispinosus]|uniref:Uncharacterized protein n=1 Tax=Temnothorax longispinosus TaxID=300112 RepID=A0A4S2KCP0_9HYME|nr:hypothetical protein DBV15_10710 [Temnothorax longispinosus]
MPKIFLIKNRLHQQQLRLLESQHLSKSPPLGSGKDSPLGSSEPLSLIVNKDQSGIWRLGNGVPPVRAVGTFGFARKLRNATRSSSPNPLSVISATAKATVPALESRRGMQRREMVGNG